MPVKGVDSFAGSTGQADILIFYSAAEGKKPVGVARPSFLP